jgi:hypothetical protein
MDSVDISRLLTDIAEFQGVEAEHVWQLKLF